MDYGRSFISVFQESSAGVGKVFILGAGLGTGHWTLWGLDTFLIFPNFLKSEFLSCLATREATLVCHVYK